MTMATAAALFPFSEGSQAQAQETADKDLERLVPFAERYVAPALEAALNERPHMKLHKGMLSLKVTVVEQGPHTRFDVFLHLDVDTQNDLGKHHALDFIVQVGAFGFIKAGAKAALESNTDSKRVNEGIKNHIVEEFDKGSIEKFIAASEDRA